MNRVKVYRNLVRNVGDHPKVRAALRARAEQIGARAEQLAAQPPAYEFDYEIVEDTRPRGRSYARVLSRDADQEFGTYGKKRRRILGRAAEET